nr:MAG TPA: hypothetical protein [Caudoviricetes sp.]
MRKGPITWCLSLWSRLGSNQRPSRCELENDPTNTCRYMLSTAIISQPRSTGIGLFGHVLCPNGVHASALDQPE